MAVQSIERAFTLLRTIAEYPDGVSVSDLARYTDLHKSTVSRLVIALEGEHAIERQNGSIHIGSGIAHLLSANLGPPTLKALVRPYLRYIADVTGETTGLCVPDQDAALYIDQISSEHPIQIRDWTGEHLPLNAVSSGKLFLAYASDDEVADYLNRVPLSKSAPNTITDPTELMLRLDKVREQGYDWSLEEYTAELSVVAGPIFDRHGKMIASIYLCGPNFRFPPDGKKEELTQLIVETCHEVTEQLKFESAPQKLLAGNRR